MVDPKGLKRLFSDVLQEQEELLENSEVILDSESPSEFASRVYGDQPESQSRKRRRASIPEQTELNANIARFDHIPQDETSFNPTAASLPPNQLVPPSNLTARPVFPHRTLPLPVPTAAPRHDPFTAATNALSRPAPPPNSLGIPSPHTGLSQPPRTHPYPSNMVSATPENEGSHRTPTRTPLPTMPTTQVVPPTAQDTWLGVVLQSTDLSIHQPRARSVSMPHVLSYGSSSSPEPRVEGAVAVADEVADAVADADVDAVADADAQPSTLQNADPTLPRAQSLSPFQNARLYRQRAQSSPLSMRGGALWTAASTPYQNGQTPVQNTPLPFQHGQFYYQNGYSKDAQPCSQNDYVQNAQNYSQNGYVQNCYAQPYDHNRLALFQNYPSHFPNYSLPFSHSSGVTARQASRSPSSGGYSSSSGGHSSPSRRSYSPPPAPRRPYRERIAPSSPVPVVPPVLGWLSKQEQLFGPPIGIMRHLYLIWRSANALGLQILCLRRQAGRCSYSSRR